MIRRLFNARPSLLPRDAGGEAWLAGLIARSAGPGLGGGHGPLLHHLARATR